MRLFTIELRKFDPNTRQRKDVPDNWLTFLKHPLEQLLEIEDIKEAYGSLEELKELSNNERIRDEYP